MPAHSGTSTQEDRNLPKYDYVTFMERFMGGSSNGNQQQTSTFAPTRPRSSSPAKPANGYTSPGINGLRPADRQYVDIF
jgi:hypothetical protein